MNRFGKTLTDIFEHYGDDAETALEAFGNIDNAAWSVYVESAAAKQYARDYGNWLRSQVREVDRDAVKSAAGHARLFEPPEGVSVLVRTVLRYDGKDIHLASLAGHRGATIAREVADRDAKQGKTMLERSNRLRQLADHVAAESDRLGRDVRFGEVLAWAESA